MKLIGREKEFDLIEGMIASSLQEGTPLSIYISGGPGTGKTATATAVIEKMLKEKKNKFTFVNINCFASLISASLCRQILEKLGQKPTRQPSTQLDSVFLEAKQPIIILLDEIDNLSSRKDALLYKAFGWPSFNKGNVILIGIANSIDLTQRFLPKLEVNVAPKTIAFVPYNRQQLKLILEQRFAEKKIEVDPKAIDLCARKVSAITGDVRRAFSIASSLETLSEEEETKENVETAEAMQMVTSSPSSSALKSRKRKNEDSPLKDLMKRPKSENVPVTPTKKNACREVLKMMDKVHSSPLQRARLPEHPQILLASLLRLLSTSPTKGAVKDFIMVTNRGKLFEAYVKVCEVRFLSPLNADQLEEALGILESHGVISLKKERICLKENFEIARGVINNNALLTVVESIDLNN